MAADDTWVLAISVAQHRRTSERPIIYGPLSTWITATVADLRVVSAWLLELGWYATWQRGATLDQRVRMASASKIPPPPTAREWCRQFAGQGQPDGNPGIPAGIIWMDGGCEFCRWPSGNAWASVWYPHPAICYDCAATLPLSTGPGSRRIDVDRACRWCLGGETGLLDATGSRSPGVTICLDCADYATSVLAEPPEEEWPQFNSIAVGPDPLDDDPDEYEWDEEAAYYLEPDPPDGECGICGYPIWEAAPRALNLCADCQEADDWAIALQTQPLVAVWAR